MKQNNSGAIALSHKVSRIALHGHNQFTTNKNNKILKFVQPDDEFIISNNYVHHINEESSMSDHGPSDRDHIIERRCQFGAISGSTPNFNNKTNPAIQEIGLNKINEYTERSHNITDNNIYSLIHLRLLLVVLLVNNASFCCCFSFSNLQHNADFFRNYHSDQPQSISFMNAFYQNPRQNYKRFVDDADTSSLLTTPMNSFTSDRNLMQPQSGPSNSWTSILTNPFGNSNQNIDRNPDTLNAHIKNILVPRVSGSPGNIQVREYIKESLRSNGYHIELDEFTGSTPIGNVKFANIIASSNPNACRQLVLACHYDSKLMDNFLGATDSAVPCAMLLKISETFNKSFKAGNDEDLKGSLGLRFIFFDGEEAFVQWSSTDSLYGSRHLAAKWQKQAAPSQCGNTNELSRIELFVLLDLIGSSDTSFVMYNQRLKHHYSAMQSYERSYFSKTSLSNPISKKETVFKNRYIPLDLVEDDHVPFKQRGVPILSLLAHPFPKVWHTIDDNYEAIDFPKTRRILYVLEEFVANYVKKT